MPTNTALEADELAFQCVALAKSASINLDAAIRETLLFILVEKNIELYRLLSEETHTQNPI